MSGEDRIAALKRFGAQALGVRDFTFSRASTDASFRRYFRIAARGQSWILMDAPPAQEHLDLFIRIARRLGALGLNVPDVIACDLVAGFGLLTDLGTEPYLQALRPDTAQRLYGDALGALIVLQTGTFTQPDFLPPYSRELLLAEMELFCVWYLERHLGVPPATTQSLPLGRLFDGLVESALTQPQVWVHRDFHSRNLMVDNRHNPGILDFQDAVCGPITYDLVSLFKDCYIAWPRAQVIDWVTGYWQLSQQSGLHQCEDPDQFVAWFDRMGVQRHLKVAGIFARLHHRDGKSAYLADLPLTIRYLTETTACYPDLRPLHDLLCALPRPS
ncbi:MAG: aminoglycoside phosphotransferase family protein [Acidiferrobacter sp.]